MLLLPPPPPEKNREQKFANASFSFEDKMYGEITISKGAFWTLQRCNIQGRKEAGMYHMVSCHTWTKNIGDTAYRDVTYKDITYRDVSYQYPSYSSHRRLESFEAMKAHNRALVLNHKEVEAHPKAAKSWCSPWTHVFAQGSQWNYKGLSWSCESSLWRPGGPTLSQGAYSEIVEPQKIEAHLGGHGGLPWIC